MHLPEFLTAGPSGDIRVTGHRIDLYHLIVYRKQGYSPEQLHEQFPTLSLEVIDQVLDFYTNNTAAVDEYVRRCQEEIDAHRAATPQRVSWDELVRRYDQHRQARISTITYIP